MSDTRRIRDDLKGIVKGEVLIDDISRTLYSTDASIFEVRPLGVVLPRDEEDLCALVRYAAEHEISLVPRGAGTGFAGESLGGGLVIDTSRYLRSILDVENHTVRVQPGVVLRELNAHLAPLGRRFAPDPSNAECTIGGMLATNASGARALRHGCTRDHVHSLRVVLDTGEAVQAGTHLRLSVPPTTTIAAQASARLNDIIASLAILLEDNASLIEAHRADARGVLFDRCGYVLHDVLLREVAIDALPQSSFDPRHSDRIDLLRLLVGSEGTLGLFTEATLRTVALPGGQAVVLLSFDSLDRALRAAEQALETGPAACDLLDRRLLALIGQRSLADARKAMADAEAVLLVEYETDRPAEAREAARTLADRLQWHERLAVRASAAWEPAEMEALRGVREAALAGLYGMRGGSRAVPLIEDVAVPRGRLPAYLDGVQKILQHHETMASFLAHVGAGQVHIRPFLDLRRPEDVARLFALAQDVHQLALELGGTVSSQHGVGLARTPWVARQFGSLYSVLRQVKAIFDPRHLFNPGKIIADVGSSSSDFRLWPLRSGFAGGNRRSEPLTGGDSVSESSSPRPSGGEQQEEAILPHPALGRTASGLATCLRWPAEDPQAESTLCHGCGLCRTGPGVREDTGSAPSPAPRMCPTFHATHAEAATPRAKANLLRGLLQQAEDLRALSSNEVRAVADLCINCKMCRHECPAHVDVPRLMLEAKAANVGRHGLDRSDWILARTESFARVGSALAPVVNTLLGNRTFRWMLEKLFGVSRRRRLPVFARHSFLRRAARNGWTHPSGISKEDTLERGAGVPRLPSRMAYFVDVFANYNDPLIAEAVVRVLHHNGIEVYVPPGQRGCGMAPLAYGDVEGARKTVLRNLHVLAELARKGYTILCSEPTAALMLKQDALDLLADAEDLADAELVASRTVELTSLLWELLQQGKLRTDFQRLDLSIGHHVPCHLKALGGPPRGPGLLALIPGLRVRTIDVSCSGMAGTFGLKRENYNVSLEAGRPMLEELSRPGVLFGSTECSTCRLQMEDGTGKHTLHPAQYLALAYGLLPELAQRLREPIRTLVL